MLVGLHVTDDAQYDLYRAGMTPILESLGGYFRYDFRVSETLKAPEGEKFNRVFVLSFPDEQTKDEFFTNTIYKKVRNIHFDRAVGAGGIISSYTLPTHP